MPVLNPQLYERLLAAFGEVRVANEGQPATLARWSPPVLGARLGRATPRSYDPVKVGSQFVSRGEQYRTKCPKCGDRRFRLYISYLWDREPTALYCQNELCHRDRAFRRELRQKVLHTDGKVLFNTPPVETVERQAVVEVPLPGRVSLLDELPDSHQACSYVRRRGYDPVELARQFHVGYCDRVAESRHWHLEDRLFIPIELGGVLVGWQGRFLGERDWRTCTVPKFYNLPDMPKRFLLYNEDQAFQEEDVVVAEGVTKVWRLGPAGLAVLGKTLSGPQVQRLASRRSRGLVIIALDGDAKDEARRAVEQLAPVLGEKVFALDVPADFDPDRYARGFLWSLIRRQADERGLRLNRIWED